MKERPEIDINSIPREHRMLRTREVGAIFGVTGQTIHRWIKANKFPKPAMRTSFPLWATEDVFAAYDKMRANSREGTECSNGCEPPDTAA